MQYRNAPCESTLTEIEKTLSFLREHAPQLKEAEGKTKWTSGNKVFCYENEMSDGTYIYMVGALKNGKVTLHMMPLYGVEKYRSEYSEALKPFNAGKSCIHFSLFSELPFEALVDIVANGTEDFFQVWLDHKAKKR